MKPFTCGKARVSTQRECYARNLVIAQPPFAELTGVRPMIETYPLEKAAEAYARMMSGNARFRVVLTM